MIIEIGNLSTGYTKAFDIILNISTIADSAFFDIRLYDELTLNQDVVVSDPDIGTLLTGKIDRIIPSDGIAKCHSRSNTAILVDSCPITSTGEFKNRTTKQIIQAIADPFGIVVEGEDGISIDKYNIEQDATCDIPIRELCIYSGLLATATSDGNLKLHKYEDSDYKTDIVLEEGVNCSMLFIADFRSVASQYSLLGQGSFLSGNSTTLASNINGLYPGTKKACIISDSITNRGLISSQCSWIQRGYDSKVETLVVRMPGIKVIEKGSFVIVKSIQHKLDYYKRLVEQVRYVNDTASKTLYTELILVLPFKYGGPIAELSGWVGETR